MSIRLRLALLYALLTSTVVAIIAFTAYALHERSSYEDIDQSLVDAAEHMRSDLASDHPILAAEALRSRISNDASVLVRLYRPDGGVLDTSPAVPAPPPLDAREVIERNDGPPYAPILRRIPGWRRAREGAFATTRDDNGSRIRLYSLPVAVSGANRGYVESWTSLSNLDHSMHTFRLTMLVLGVASVIAVSLGSVLVAGHALRPVASLGQTARMIAASRSFSRRLPEHESRDELWQMAHTFNEMLAALEGSFRSQQRFAADASHELRAPLTVIQGNAELLANVHSMPADEQAEAVSYIRGEADRMSRLVAELLTLARADAGQRLERVPVELDAVVLEAISTTASGSPDSNVKAESIEPLQVVGDAEKLKQLVIILLDNAIKYSPRGWAVRVSLARSGSNGVIRIADSGIGIPADHLPHIFDRFYRVDAARSRETGGTGLGLSIARWIVQEHKGEIAIDSIVGRGTTVTVRLPLRAPTDAKRPADAVPALASSS